MMRPLTLMHQFNPVIMSDLLLYSRAAQQWMRFRLIILLMACFGFTGIQGQTSVVVGGGNSPYVTFTIGQPVYESNGYVWCSIQQPYEISVVTGVEDNREGVEMSIYPNPVADVLTLKVNLDDFFNCCYQLYDSKGGLLQQQSIVDASSSIGFDNYTAGIYYLVVVNDKHEIKRFKIIKR